MLITSDSPLQPQPEGIRGKLYRHQQASLYKMLEWENNPTMESPNHLGSSVNIRSGFYCDQVAAGKTVTSLALALSRAPPAVPANRVIHSNQLGSVRVPSRETTMPRAESTLIVVPHSLIKHWQTNVEDWLSPEQAEKAAVIRTKKQAAVYIGAEDGEAHTPPWLVICSSTRWREFGSEYAARFVWDRILYDEADSLRIPKNPHVLGRFYWFITATPERWNMSTSGYLRELYYQLTFLVHDRSILFREERRQYDGLFVECATKFVSESLNLPPIEEIEIACRLDQMTAMFGNVMLHSVRMALEAGDMTAVLNHFDCTTEDELEEQVTASLRMRLMHAQARQQYLQSIGRVTTHVDGIVDEIQRQLDGLRARLSDTTCSICLDTLRTPTATTPCGHRFCMECMMHAMERSNECPLCRAHVCAETLTVTTDQVAEPVDVSPTRWQALEKIVKENEISHTLIFSDYGFDKVRAILVNNRVRFAELKGSNTRVPKLISQFVKGELPVLLLHSRFQGQGHHLPQTKKVIILHDVPEATREQVIGRAQRVGRTEPLQVFTLVTPEDYD